MVETHRDRGGDLSAVTRRSLLTTGTSLATFGVAGCLWDDTWDPGTEHRYDWDVDDPPTATTVDGQVFHLPTVVDPAAMSFLWDLPPIGVPFQPFEAMFQATHEPGMWGRWWSDTYWSVPGESTFHLYEDIDIDTETITIELRPDARWSDGTPVSAYDIAATVAIWRRPRDPDGEVSWRPSPTEGQAYDAVGAVDFPDGPDGTTVTLELQSSDDWQQAGGFTGAIDRGELLYWIAGPSPRLGVRIPAHVEPYSSVIEEALDDFNSKADDIDSLSDLTERHVTRDDHERLRTADGYVSTGVWTLGDVVGSRRVELVPNEYHRHRDELNFEQINVEFHGDLRLFPALRSERLDHAVLDVGDESLEALPDRYERVFAPSPEGIVLAFDHAGRLGDVRVRQAIAHVIDRTSVSQAIPETFFDPIDVPGGDLEGIETVISSDWIGETLREYDVDHERAASLLEDAGFERNNADVWERAGEPLEFQYLSRHDDSFDAEVESQLESFGIVIDAHPVDESIMMDPNRFDGEWQGDDTDARIDESFGGRSAPDLWAGDRTANRLAGTVSNLTLHWIDGFDRRGVVRGRNYYDHDRQENVLATYEDTGVRIDAWDEWTIDIPPIGEPDGSLRPFNPAFTAARIHWGDSTTRDPQPENPYYDPPDAVPSDRNRRFLFEQFAWATNWWLPVLPILRRSDQHLFNTAHWILPRDFPSSESRRMWEYFGQGWGIWTLLATNHVLANPKNPKPEN